MPSSKMLRRVLSLCCLIVYLVVTESVLGYILTPESYSWSYNYDVRELEKENAAVDMIFIGASRTLRTFNPKVFEEEMHLSNCLNAGSSLQLISGTYHHLNYLLTKFKPRYVVLGVTWDGLIERENSLQSKLIINDRMGGISANKLRYEIDVFTMEEMPYLLDSWRFKNYFEADAIRNNLDSRNNLKKNNYIGADFGIGSYYAGKGFVYSHSTISNGNTPMLEAKSFCVDNIDSEKLSYLNKIVKLCKDNDIVLCMVSAPMTVARMYQIDGYSEAVEWYENYAKENGILYHNTNYLKDREAFLPDNMMHDFNHVNGKGAEVVSTKYAEILKKELDGKNTKDYFYKNFEEFAESVERIAATGANIKVTGNTLNITVDSVHNTDVIPEYEILLSLDGNEYCVQQTYSVKTSYTLELPQCKEYTIRVNARQAGSDAVYEAYQEYEYLQE